LEGRPFFIGVPVASTQHTQRAEAARASAARVRFDDMLCASERERERESR
jgi:hypothetical protein